MKLKYRVGLGAFLGKVWCIYIPKTYKINSPVLSKHENLACLGSGVLQLGDSLLFSSLDLSAETNFEDNNISDLWKALCL